MSDMAEEASNAMNLDLNLGPDPSPSSSPEPGSGPVPLPIETWINEPFRRLSYVTARHRARQRWRWRQFQNHPGGPLSFSMDLNELMVNSTNGTELQPGEGSAAAEERANEIPKSCENNTGFADDGGTEKKEDGEKGGGNDGSFFDCNVCLDLARDPVVTCCGHLFCWPCLYRWLHLHPDVKECPVCKGEVTVKNVTPIYGRGNHGREPDDDSELKVPVRPHARRVESLRQTIQRTTFNFPMEEMIRHLGNRFDLTPAEPESESTHETVARTSSFHDGFMLARRLRDHIPIVHSDDAADLGQSGTGNLEGGESRRPHPILLRRQHSHRNALSTLSSTLTAERLMEAYLRNQNIGRNQEQPPPVDDRDSFSSVAADINPESQVDTAMEIDSLVSLSTSSSRRRSDPSRASDLDSGDSRAPRRRRLN